MRQVQGLTQAEVDRMTDEQLRTLEKATDRLGDEMQRQAAYYQRQAARLRKAIQTRNRRGYGERA